MFFPAGILGASRHDDRGNSEIVANGVRPGIFANIRSNRLSLVPKLPALVPKLPALVPKLPALLGPAIG